MGIYVGYFQGISGAMPGPTLLDLQEITHSETDEISVVFIVKSVRFKLVRFKKQPN